MTYVSTCLADGAGGLWELAESSGLTTVDQAGNANASSGSAPTWGLTGIPGGGGATAAACRLSNLHLDAASVAAQQLADSAMTVECWVQRSATQGATQRITGAGNGSGAQFGWNSSNQLQVGKIGVANIVASTVAVTDTASWHHLVWTKAGATNHLYIDGTDVTGSVSNQTLTTAAGWKLFQDASNNNNPPVDMGLAMVAIYKSVLTPTQVANHYALGSGIGGSVFSSGRFALQAVNRAAVFMRRWQQRSGRGWDVSPGGVLTPC